MPRFSLMNATGVSTFGGHIARQARLILKLQGLEAPPYLEEEPILKEQVIHSTS